MVFDIQQNKQMFIICVSLLFILNYTTLVALLLFSRVWRKRNQKQSVLLQEALEASRKIAATSNEEELDAVVVDESLCKVMQPYREWALKNHLVYQELDNAQQSMEEAYAMHCLHIEENKRQHVERRAKLALVNGIVPYLDRIIREVNKLDESDHRVERLQYIDELVARINDYNEIGRAHV